MQKFQFINIDSVLAKFKRDFRGLDINENDAIEWVGEALGFMKIPSASQENVAFLEVKNYQAPLPNGLHYITQIARNNEWESSDDCQPCVQKTVKSLSEVTTPTIFEDCQGNLVDCNLEPVYYRPLLNMQCDYNTWSNSSVRRNKYTPVRLSNHSFFNTLVCKEKGMEDIYRRGCSDEYTIVQDELRFNFKEGLVAVAYVGQMIDHNTGYPMIPDDEYARAAISYYIGWKVKENECWNHREGACQLAERAKGSWESYIKKFKNKAKMPTGVDQYQNLLEGAYSLIPNHRKYYGFFGKLGNTDRFTFATKKRNGMPKDQSSGDNEEINNTTVIKVQDEWDSNEW